MIFLESYLESMAHFSKELNAFGEGLYFSLADERKGK